MSSTSVCWARSRRPGRRAGCKASRATPEAALEAIRAEIGPATRLIAVSHVAWTTGNVLPLAELAALGVPVLADGA